jgi:arylsulfatase A-like enzyme
VASGEIRAAYENADVTDSSDDGHAGVIAALEQLDFVADVMTVDELAGPASADSFVTLYQRSYYPGRVHGPLARNGLVLRLKEGLHGGPEPTTHGSPYLYDRHVPLIFLGPGIRTGQIGEHIRTIDVAPSLAQLTGIPYPADVDGRPFLGF